MVLNVGAGKQGTRTSTSNKINSILAHVNGDLQEIRECLCVCVFVPAFVLLLWPWRRALVILRVLPCYQRAPPR
jgi:hypothetical protein